MKVEYHYSIASFNFIRNKWLPPLSSHGTLFILLCRHVIRVCLFTNISPLYCEPLKNKDCLLIIFFPLHLRKMEERRGGKGMGVLPTFVELLLSRTLCYTSDIKYFF